MQQTVTSPARISRYRLASLGRAAATRPRFAWWRSMPLAVRACVALLLLFAAAALFAPALAPRDPETQSLLARLQAPVGFGGSTDYPLGTDHLGRDVLSRLLHGARVSLAIGLVGMTIGVTLGTAVGLVAGFARGVVDHALMFLVDVQLAIPFIIVALTAIAIFGTDLRVLILLVGLADWEKYARLARGMVLSAREQQYVLAAQSLGATRLRVMLRHILPNILAPIIVLATFQLTSIIILESSLSFLGIGVQPPTPSWGSMVGEGRGYLNTAWWIAIVPGGAIVLVTMAISLVGDWLRDVLDPTLRGR